MKQLMVYMVCLFFCTPVLKAAVADQTAADTIPVKILQPVTVNTTIHDSVTYLPDIADGFVFAGKKTNWLKTDQLSANLPQNNIRQALAKIPGITSWDMDGAGTQLNIGSRGTDSHRSIEM